MYDKYEINWRGSRRDSSWLGSEIRLRMHILDKCLSRQGFWTIDITRALAAEERFGISTALKPSMKSQDFDLSSSKSSSSIGHVFSKYDLLSLSSSYASSGFQMFRTPLSVKVTTEFPYWFTSKLRICNTIFLFASWRNHVISYTVEESGYCNVIVALDST